MEVGANVGYFSVQAALENSELLYTAVEPHPYVASVLRRNLALNGITTVDVIEAAAVSDASQTTVELAVPNVDHFAAPAGGLLRR